MSFWEEPIYDRGVARMGAGGLRANYEKQHALYNQAYNDWLQRQQMTGDPTAPGEGPPFPGGNTGGGLVPGTAVGDGPAFPMVTGDPTSPGSGPPFPSFQGPTGSVAPNNPPSGPTTIQDRPLPGVAGAAPGFTLPYLPQEADLNRLLNTMGQYRQRNQDAYSSQMGGGWSGGVLPADMQQTFADGGQFRANPTSGVRPNNPFAQTQPSYGQPGAPTGASFGGNGGLGGLGGSGPFQISNPYAPR